MYKQFDIVQVNLNPTKGSEQRGVRPCIIIQNNYANAVAQTYVVAIISSRIKEYPHTVIVESSEENGLETVSRIDFLQVRTVDVSRIMKLYGSLDKKYVNAVKKSMKIAFGIS